MTDSNIDPLSNEAPLSHGVAYALIPHGKGTALEVRLDRAWLDDPARRYPVVVDPQLATAARADDTYVMNSDPSANSSENILKVGTFNGGYDIARAFMHFDTGAINYATVTNAQLHLAERWSYNCAYPPEPVWRVASHWDGAVLWPNQPATDPGAIAGGSFANAGCHNRLAVWDVTSAAAGWAANPGSNFGLSLRASNEYDSNRWKKYASIEDGAPPALHVTYNHAPITPWGVAPANYAHIIGSTTGASATYADADGGSGYIAFGVWNGSGQLVWSAWSPPVCTWCATSVSVPALPDGWYNLQTIAWDGQATSPAWSPAQAFFIDTVPPPPPTNITPAPGASVTSPVTVSARYTEPYGWPGTVQFNVLTSAGGQGPILSSAVTCYGCVASVTLPALAPGTYTLYARAYDGAYSPWAPAQTLTIATPPGAPTGLNAVPGPESAQLRWTAAPSNQSAVSHYDLTAYDGTNPEVAPITRRCQNPCSPTDGFLFQGLIAQHLYTFGATATNSVGTGPQSGSSNAITAQAWAAYTPSVTATPLDRAVKVDWQAELFATSYRVRTYRGVPPTNGVPRPADFVAQTDVGVLATTTVPGLVNGTTYYFTVTPAYLLILIGPESLVSNAVSPYGTPFPPTVTSVEAGDGTSALSWREADPRADGTPGNNGSPVNSYTVRVFKVLQQSADLVRTIPDIPAAPGENSLSLTELDNGSMYYFTVAATNAAASPSEPAQSATVNPSGRPFPPVQVRAEAGSLQAQVSWEPPTARNGVPGDNGAPLENYRIIVEGSPCPDCANLTAGPEERTRTVLGLEPATTYTFRVIARNRNGEGPPSEMGSNPVTTPAEAPDEPLSVRPQPGPGEGQITLSWEPPARDNGATIEGYDVLIDPLCAGCQNMSVSGGTTTTVVQGLRFGIPYTFQVVARNRVGSSPASVRSDPPVHSFARTRAMTWNIRNAQDSGLTAIATRILFHEVDVVGLQEISSSNANDLLDQLQARTASTWYLHKDGTNAILSRLPLTGMREERFSNEAGRGVIRASFVEMPSGETVHVYDTHLTVDKDREVQVRAVLAMIDHDREAAGSGPFRAVLLGDFNEPGIVDDEPGPAPRIELVEQTFSDSWLTVHPELEAPNDDAVTYPSLRARIDFVFVDRSSAMEAETSTLDKTPALSDHRPVVTHLLIRAE